MKKLLLGTLCLLGIGTPTMASQIIQPDLDKILNSYKLTPNTTEKTLSLYELQNYKSCKEFTQMQSKYQILNRLWFIKYFGYTLGESLDKYSAYFSTLATSTPKNFIQQTLFPYGNSIYAEQGSGTQLFCEGEADNFYQMGVLQLKGYVVVQDKEIQGIDEEYGEKISATMGETYFLITEYKDPTIEKLPYLTMIQGKKSFLMGCFAKENGVFLDYYFDNLGVMVDVVQNTYMITSSMFSDKKVENMLKKSAEHPGTEITINVQLRPNVIFNHGLDIPCENSWIQSIEIVDDGGLL